MESQQLYVANGEKVNRVEEDEPSENLLKVASSGGILMVLSSNDAMVALVSGDFMGIQNINVIGSFNRGFEILLARESLNNHCAKIKEYCMVWDVKLCLKWSLLSFGPSWSR